MPHERITEDSLGLDEILLEAVNVHIERMDKGAVWLGITRAGRPEQRLSVIFSAHGKALRGRVLENEIGVAASEKS